MNEPVITAGMLIDLLRAFRPETPIFIDEVKTRTVIKVVGVVLDDDGDVRILGDSK